jgi:hypothetical protein
MKTRNGFVSSSFIVAIQNKETECECCHKSNKWILQAISKYMTTLTKDGNKLRSMASAIEVEQHFNGELKTHKESKIYFKHQLAEIIDLLSNQKVFENYQRVCSQLSTIRSKITLRQEAEMGEINSMSPQDALSHRREMIESMLNTHDAKVTELETIIDEVKKAIKEDKTVYTFTIDNWASEAENCLQQMINDGVVELIQRVES